MEVFLVNFFKVKLPKALVTQTGVSNPYSGAYVALVEFFGSMVGIRNILFGPIVSVGCVTSFRHF